MHINIHADQDRVIVGKLTAQHLKTGLLLVSVALAALSVVPSVGLGGTIAMRSVLLLSAGASLIHNWTKEDHFSRFSKCMRVALVIIGIAGVATGMSILSLVSIGGGLALSLLNLRELRNSNKTKIISHLFFLVVNSLLFAALLSGTWQTMTATSIVSATLMTGLAARTLWKAKSPIEVVDGLCYLGIGATAIFNASSRAHTAQIGFDQLS